MFPLVGLGSVALKSHVSCLAQSKTGLLYVSMPLSDKPVSSLRMHRHSKAKPSNLMSDVWLP